jgi:hypothetical protein
MNGAVSKVTKKSTPHLTRIKATPSAAPTVQFSHVLPAVHFSSLLGGSGPVSSMASQQKRLSVRSISVITVQLEFSARFRTAGSAILESGFASLQ